jgi:tRNA(Ile)-lysidine synthase
MAERVELAFRRAAMPLLPRGSAVLAAVSGGGDSIALLHLLATFAPRLELRLGVAHLDHGLRRGSRVDRRFVERLARDLGLALHADRREVAVERRRDESPEEAARRVRRQFLLETAAAEGYTRIALGHTLDDQAETILLRLARGTGSTGLTGMAASGPGPLVRPLLGVERQELRDYLCRRKLVWREDPSNRDLGAPRNGIRRRVLPLLAALVNPRAARHLVHAAARLRQDAAHLDAIAAAEFERLSRPGGEGGLTLEARRLAALPAPIAERVARLALCSTGVDARRVGSRQVTALLDLAPAGRRRRVDLPGGRRAQREGAELWIGR